MMLKLGAQVPYKETVVSEAEFAQILKKGYEKLYGITPSMEVLGGAWAQVILESGRNPIKLPNNNIGNIKATSDWKDNNDYFVKGTVEFDKNGNKLSAPNAEWRAYDTPIDGAIGYWELLGNKRFNKAMEWMEAGDPKSASVVLGLTGYYTANIKEYSEAVNSIYSEFINKIAPFVGVKSEAKAPPGEKPLVKNWSSEYSDDEKISLLSTSKVDINDKIDELIYKLVATKLPENNILVNIKTGKEEYKLEFARLASSILKSNFDIESDILANDETVDLQCTGKGSEEVLSGVVDAVCSVVSKKINTKFNEKLSFVILPGLLSRGNYVDSETILKNNRAIHYERILNG